jgi:hypothetical protein
MATLLELKAQITRIVEAIFAPGDDLLNDGINEAFMAILPWCYYPQTVTLEATMTETAFALPDDFYRVVGVLDGQTGYWIPQGTISADSSPANGSLNVNNDYVLFPHNQISFANALTKGGELYYAAYWPYPSDETAALAIPEWAVPAVKLYAASTILYRAANDTASVRQWNLQIDSGNPLHNPIIIMADKTMSRFQNYMNSQPARVRGTQ